MFMSVSCNVCANARDEPIMLNVLLKVTQTLAVCIASYLTITLYRYVLYVPKLYTNIIANYS